MAPGPRISQLRAGNVHVADSAFPAGILLDWHTHDTPILAVFLHGSMDVQFRRQRFDCRRTAVQVHPAGERNRQRYGRAGARILVVEPDADGESWTEALGGFLATVHHFADEHITGLARLVQAELAAPDDVTPLAVQGLAYEILVRAARRTAPRSTRRLPSWLARATDLVHAEFRERLRLPDIAAEVGVHPAHLARTFREHHHASLGSFVRRLRMDWAAARLAESSDPLSQVALDAGFADQSHFTRAFRRHTGLTPARYREMKQPREPGRT